MGNKKGKSSAKKPQHASLSFAQMVGKANQEALKPYIDAVMGQMADELSKRLFRQLGNIQTRIMAMEDILMNKFEVTEREIESAVATIEDDAWQYQLAERPAKEGDLLRVTIRTREPDKEFSKAVKRQITSLMSKPYSMGSPTIEEAMVGMTAGETKEVSMNEGKYLVEILVERVSEKIPQPEAAKVEAAPTGEGQDTPAPAEGTENANPDA